MKLIPRRFNDMVKRLLPSFKTMTTAEKKQYLKIKKIAYMADQTPIQGYKKRE